MQTYTIDIRPRRQTTIPKPLLEQVNASVGDKLVASIEGKRIILKPQKKVALDILKEMQLLVKESGVSQKEAQANIGRIRKEIYAKRYS
ncbi:AbrB/MazE/SpoVT family DNA-binding domain-containing protein [Candidatus Gottesmanbacteria bacterium]|nr:AbrB/MazE/SpoVT family DNA-binding domain-containing protein [Candidatus Gottesmanbacteria bacterium]